MNQEIGINLESLFDLSAKLNTEANEEFIHNSVLLTLMGKLGVTKSAIFSFDGEKFVKSITKGTCNITQIPTKIPNKMVMVDQVNNIALKENGFKYLIPLLDDKKFLAVILLGDKINQKTINMIEQEYIKLVSSIASIAIKNSKNINKLKNQREKAERKSQLLESIFSISKYFSSILNKDQIINHLKFSLMGQLMVNKFAFVLEENNQIDLIVNLFETAPEKHLLKRIRELSNVSTPEILFSNKDITDSEFEYLHKIGVGVLSPMQIHGNSRGWLVLGKKLNEESFTEDNLSFIESIGNLAIKSLENLRLIKEEVAKKQLESEMNLASEIQQRLLPDKNPVISDYEIAGLSKPSKTVGGDYYDFIKIDSDRCFIVIADVSGKGLPAAMIMANLQSILRVLVPLKLPLKEIVFNINDLLYENTAPDKFVTMFCGILNHKTNTLQYINAGHNPPIYSTNSQFLNLKEGGLILGLIESSYDYGVGEIKIEKGSNIFFFTDGVNEAQTYNKKEFGMSRVEGFISCNHNLPANQFLDKLFNQLTEFSSGNYSDDITAIYLKRI